MSLSNYPKNFLWCRAFGHKWDEYIPGAMRKPEFGWRFSLLCTSCGAERHDIYDVTGRVTHRKYYYPDGYYLGGIIKRSEARSEWQQRNKILVHRGNMSKKI